MIDVGGMTRHVLHEEAIAVARMGLVAVLGISGNLNPGRVGLALACSGPYTVVTQGVFPVDEVADRAIQGAVGLGAVETFLAIVIFLPLALVVTLIAVGHVGNVAVGLKVAAGLHAGLTEHVLVHIGLKGCARRTLHNLIDELECGVDVLILGAGPEIQVIERAHVLHRGDVVAVEHKIAVAAGTRIGDARSVAHDVVQSDVLEERCLELGEKLRQGIIK